MRRVILPHAACNFSVASILPQASHVAGKERIKRVSWIRRRAVNHHLLAVIVLSVAFPLRVNRFKTVIYTI